MPDPIRVEEIAMGDSFATARLYDRFIQIFLSTALGWDFDKHESKPQGGLFGKVKAFYGLTEPQMDGHPHMHLLVWSEDLPRTTIQYEDMVEGDDEEEEEDNCNNLNSATAKYTDSVVRRTLPLSLSHSFCDECSTETEFHVLPIKQRYKMNTLPQHQPSRFFPSFFITQLLSKRLNNYDYRQVRRWTKSFDVFVFEKLYFPINISNSHWTLAVVYMQTRRIQYYDSLHSTTTTYLTALKRWIQDEHADKKGSPLPRNEDWELIPCSSETTPKQANGYDCGVFTIMSADLIASNLDIMLISQNHMPMLRRRIALDIVQGHLESS